MTDPLTTGEGTGSALGQKASEMRARAEAWLAGQWRRDETASIAAATDFARDVVALLEEVEELRAGASLADNLADNLARVQKHLQFKAAECGRLREQLDAAHKVVRAFTAEAEDWNDGEYALWKKDDLIMALVRLRAVVAAATPDTPQEDLGGAPSENEGRAGDDQ